MQRGQVSCKSQRGLGQAGEEARCIDVRIDWRTDVVRDIRLLIRERIVDFYIGAIDLRCPFNDRVSESTRACLMSLLIFGIFNSLSRPIYPGERGAIAIARDRAYN